MQLSTAGSYVNGPFDETANNISIENGVIKELSHVVSYAATYSLLNDINRKTHAAFERIQGTIASQSTNATLKTSADAASPVAAGCDLTPYTHVIDQIGELRKRLDQMEEGIHNRYLTKLDEFLSFVELNERYEKLALKANQNLTSGKEK